MSYIGTGMLDVLMSFVFFTAFHRDLVFPSITAQPHFVTFLVIVEPFDLIIQNLNPNKQFRGSKSIISSD
jgi:hypothetical protein